MLIIANWKMNPLTLKEAYKLLDFYKKLDIEIWVAPPSIFLAKLIEKYPNFNFGAQNVFFEKNGPYTGEISARMIKNLGGKFVIVNHSERRKLGEDFKIANLKIKSILKENLIPVVCLGEEKPIQSINKLKRKWEENFNVLFKGIKEFKKIIIAYEPTWAISTYKIGPVQPNIVKEFIKWINKFNFKKIIYGGSVFPETIESYLDLNLDGFLIGSKSLSKKDFKKIVNKIKTQ